MVLRGPRSVVTDSSGAIAIVALAPLALAFSGPSVFRLSTFSCHNSSLWCVTRQRPATSCSMRSERRCRLRLLLLSRTLSAFSPGSSSFSPLATSGGVRCRSRPTSCLSAAIGPILIRVLVPGVRGARRPGRAGRDATVFALRVCGDERGSTGAEARRTSLPVSAPRAGSDDGQREPLSAAGDGRPGVGRGAQAPGAARKRGPAAAGMSVTAKRESPATQQDGDRCRGSTTNRAAGARHGATALLDSATQ